MNPCAMWIALLKLLIGIIRKKISQNYLLADASFIRSAEGPNPSEVALFSASGSDNSCKLYRAYAIVIEGEHARYYLKPDQDTKYFSLKPKVARLKK